MFVKSNRTNWYVITGGPASGKSKTLEYLAFLGHLTIPEVARILIDTEISQGRTIHEIREDEGKFQEECLAKKIELERRLPPNQVTILDRGIPDSLVYYNIAGLDPSAISLDILTKRLYRKIFWLEPLDSYQPDYSRVEDLPTALKISESLYQTYIDLRYEVIKVPVMSIPERAKLIQHHLSRDNIFESTDALPAMPDRRYTF